ncbi:MAG: HMA2 domain-containing protein [Methylocystis sp.]
MNGDPETNDAAEDGEPKSIAPQIIAGDDAASGPTPLENLSALPDEVAAYRRIAGAVKLKETETPEAPVTLYDYWTYPTRNDEPSFGDVGDNDVPLSAEDVKASKRKKKKKKKSRIRLEIAHQTTGRVRLKVPAGKNDQDLLKKIADTFSGIPGMERITVSPVTGSIILNYNEDNQKSFNDRLMRNLMAQGGAPMIGSEFEELAKKIENQAEFLAERSQTARVVVDLFKNLDREIKIATHNVVDLKIVLAVGVIALTVLEVGTNAATPIWLTLSIFTFNHFVELRNSVDMETASIRAPIVLR